MAISLCIDLQIEKQTKQQAKRFKTNMNKGTTNWVGPHNKLQFTWTFHPTMISFRGGY
jgi:hypothetical protein